LVTEKQKQYKHYFVYSIRMHTFLQIIQAVFNGAYKETLPIHYLDGNPQTSYYYLKEQSFHEALLPESERRGVEKQFFIMYILENHVTFRTKFAFVSDVLENIFMTDKTRMWFMNYFAKIQRVYHVFAKFAYRYRHKITPLLITKDVYLNNLTEGAPRVFSLVQNKKKYLFSITDLINILNTSLGNNFFFVAEPLPCKNPYTNLPFNKSTLYNIYFFIKRTDFIMPQMFHEYFMTNFNLREYAEQNDELILEYAIKQFTLHTDVEELFYEITTMLEGDRFGRKIKIDPDFPQERLVDIMRPYLELYYKGTYSVNEAKRSKYLRDYCNKIKLFHAYNNKFGQKTMTRITKTKPFCTSNINFAVTFNDKHIVFGSEYKDDFYTSHLYYNCSNNHPE